MANIAEVLKELRDERDRLDKAITALVPLTKMNGNSAGPRTGRNLSASARRKIAAAQRARWARVRVGSPAKARLRKRGISAAGRKAIAAAQRARWAKLKKEKKAA